MEPGVVEQAVTAPVRLKQFCKQHFRHILGSKQGCIAAISRGDVVVDGAPVTDSAVLLTPGSVVSLSVNPGRIDEAQHALPLEVCFEDAAVAVVWKPSGLPTRGPGRHTLALALPHALQGAADSGPPVPVHHLPRGVAGLVLVAKAPAIDAVLRDSLRQGAVSCVYRAVAQGRLPPGYDNVGTRFALPRSASADDGDAPASPEVKDPNEGEDSAITEEAELENEDPSDVQNPVTTGLVDEGLSDAGSNEVCSPATTGRCRWRRRRRRMEKKAARIAAVTDQASLDATGGPEWEAEAEVVEVCPSRAVGQLYLINIYSRDPCQGQLEGPLRRGLRRLGLTVVGTKDAFTAGAARAGLQKQKFHCCRGLYLALVRLEVPHPTDGTRLCAAHPEPEKFRLLMRREASAAERLAVEPAPATRASSAPSAPGESIDFLPYARTPSAGQCSTADTPNRQRDKARVEARWRLPEFGTTVVVEFRLLDGMVLAVGYTRVVYGDHGPYVEFERDQVRFSGWVPGPAKQHPDRFYDEWYAAGGRVKLYDQLRPVTGQCRPPAGLSAGGTARPEGYADYRAGRCYLELSDSILLARVEPHSPPLTHPRGSVECPLSPPTAVSAFGWGADNS